MFVVPDNINLDNGVYLVMTYYGCEGWAVIAQFHEAEEALLSLSNGTVGGPQMIVKPVDFMFMVTDQ